jgi:hypothetical protein
MEDFTVRSWPRNRTMSRLTISRTRAAATFPHPLAASFTSSKAAWGHSLEAEIATTISYGGRVAVDFGRPLTDSRAQFLVIHAVAEDSQFRAECRSHLERGGAVAGSLGVSESAERTRGDKGFYSTSGKYAVKFIKEGQRLRVVVNDKCAAEVGLSARDAAMLARQKVKIMVIPDKPAPSRGTVNVSRIRLGPVSWTGKAE